MAQDLTELHRLRAEQDEIDKKLVEALADRYKKRKEISAFRIENGLPTVDEERKQQVLQQAEALAEELNVPAEYVLNVFHVLIEGSHTLDRAWRQSPDKLKI